MNGVNINLFHAGMERAAAVCVNHAAQYRALGEMDKARALDVTAALLRTEVASAAFEVELRERGL